MSFNLSPEVHLHSPSSLVGIHQIPQAHTLVFPCLFLLHPPWFWYHRSLSSLVRNFGMFSHSRFFLIPIFRSKPVTVSRSLYLPISFHTFLFLSPFIKCPLPSRWHINTRNVARRFGRRHGRNFSSGFVCYNISTVQSHSYSNTQVLLNANWGKQLCSTSVSGSCLNSSGPLSHLVFYCVFSPLATKHHIPHSHHIYAISTPKFTYKWSSPIHPSKLIHELSILWNLLQLCHVERHIICLFAYGTLFFYHLLCASLP